MLRSIPSLFLVLLSSTTTAGANAVSFDDDIQFVQVAFATWEDDASKNLNGPDQVEEFITGSEQLLEEYKKGNMPFSGFPHTQEGLDAVYFLMDNTLALYRAARTKSWSDFIDFLEMEKIGIRTAINTSTSHEELRKNIRSAIDESMASLGGNHGGKTRAEDLQLVHFLVFSWQSDMNALVQERTPSTPEEYVALAKSAMDTIKTQTGADASSSDASGTALFIIGKYVEVMAATKEKSDSTKRFMELLPPRIELLDKALIKGLTVDRSLDLLRKNVEAAANAARESLYQ